MNMKNNGITGRSFINLSTTFNKDLSKSFTQYKRLNTESTKNSEKTITTSNIKKELFSIDEFKEYMNIKNMLKLNFMKIDGIISSIVSSHKCR